jgi:hypothetical protein
VTAGERLPKWMFAFSIGVLLVAYAGGAGVVSSGAAAGRSVASEQAAVGTLPAGRGHCPDVRRGIVWYRAATKRWREQVGARSGTRTSARPRSCKQARALARVWWVRARVARHHFEVWFEATYDKWRCIHLREAAWNDAGAPYHGGLQMDWSFMRAYGPRYAARWGHAGRWPVWAQLVAAERGWRSRGWQPWPNTARMCGLL